MINIKNVIKKYKKNLIALNNINVYIKEGEFVFIVGPSGSGKTTFIKLIYKETNITKGNISVFNYNFKKMKKKEIPYLRRKIGVIFQDYKLLLNKTVYENIAYAMRVIGKRPKIIKKRVINILKLIGLFKKIKSFPNELSGGEQQRVSIARAIINFPKILIADEPTGNLDFENENIIMKLLNYINSQGITVIMATHNKNIINKFNHRIIYIKNGNIIKDLEKRKEKN